MTRLTVLGSAGSHPGPHRACSSYLVESDGYRLLLDCGNGSLSNLLRTIDPRDLGAIVVSHRHHDHWADLIGLYYALRFDRRGPTSLPVYAPKGTQEFLAQVVSGDEEFGQVLRFSPVAAGDRLALGPFDVELFAGYHPVDVVMSRVRVDTTTLTYTADTDYCDAAVSAARDADLLVADSTWLSSAGPYDPGIHMTGRASGRLAAQAGARRLLVTHVWPGFDPAEVAAEAAEEFDGVVEAAADLQVVQL